MSTQDYKEEDRLQNLRDRGGVDNSSRHSESRGSQGTAENWQGKFATECWYYGKKGHRERECWKKKADLGKSRSSKAEQQNPQRSHYDEGSRGAKNGLGPSFVMKATTSKPNKVWYVESGESNHMASHEEWFSYLEKPEQPRVVDTEDDTPHPIKHVGEIPLSHVGQKGRLMSFRQ